MVTSIAEFPFLCNTKQDGLKQLTAQPTGEAFQRGQVLYLQVVWSDVAVLHCAAVEIIEEFLEDVVDADACQNVALLNVAVQRLWDKMLVAGGIRIEKQIGIYKQLAGKG